MVTWLHQFGPVVRQKMMAGSVWWGKAAHLMMANKDRKEWGDGETETRLTDWGNG
jgi:hypothetical protein